MRILIIGGGRFLGRAFAAEALAAGHQVTVFNRGKTSVDPDGVRVVHGDRENPADLARLVAAAPAAQTSAQTVAHEDDASPDPAAGGGSGWDAVVDTCGFKPAVVGSALRRWPEVRARTCSSPASTRTRGGRPSRCGTVRRSSSALPRRRRASTARSRPAASAPCWPTSRIGRSASTPA